MKKNSKYRALLSVASAGWFLAFSTAEATARSTGHAMACISAHVNPQAAGFLLHLSRHFLSFILLTFVSLAGIAAFLCHRLLKATKSREQKFKSIIENVQDVYYRRDLQDNLLMLSPSGARMLGYESVDEILNRNLNEVFQIDEQERERFKKALDENGMVHKYEIDIRKRDGSTVTILTNSHYVYDKKGQRIGVEGIFTDITRQKEIERQLMLQSRALEQSIDGICVADTEGILQFTNKAWAEMHGYTLDELPGKHIRVFHTPEQFETDVLPFIEKVRAAGGYQGEVGHKRKDGSTFPTHMSVTLLRHTDDTPFGLIGIARDISEQKKAHRELLEAKQAAEVAAEAKSQFLANMSHEIRTPLNAIMGMNELLLDTDLDKEQQDYAETVRVSAEALFTVINDILDFSKIEAGKLTLEEIPFNLQRILEDVLQMLLPKVEKKNLQLDVNIDTEIPKVLNGDPTRIRQILINLVNNAIKFTERGSISIDVKKLSCIVGHEHLLHFSVRDTGIGIPKDKQESIFDSFSQADTSTTRQFGGTGLGLSICKQLVQLMGGEIGVKSEPQKGSTFWFTLKLKAVDGIGVPPAPQDTTVRIVNESRSVAKPPEDVRILLAEDNPFNVKFIKQFLKKQGYQVFVANNGEQAVKMVQQQPFDLVLMDMQMPVMDGLEATKQIRASEPNPSHRIPIIALTANALASHKDCCLEAGMDDYVSKPVKQAHLLSVIEKTLKHLSHSSEITTR